MLLTPRYKLVGTKYYYVEISNTGGCSSAVSAISTVRVVEDPVATISSSDSSLCIGGSIELSVTTTGGTSTPSYQWYYFNILNPSVVNRITGATSATYQTGTELSIKGTYKYYVEVTYDGSGCDLARSNDLEVTVDSVPTLDNGGDLVDSTGVPFLFQEVCQGGNPEPLYVEVNSSDIGVQNSVTNGIQTQLIVSRWYTNLRSKCSLLITPVSSPVGVTTFYYVEVSQSGSGCVVVSNTSSVIVNATKYY